jgi:hypothetical protein
MIDGFYLMAFTGVHGSGFGMLVLRDGNIAGADVAGSTYDGTYVLNPQTREVKLEATMFAPAGVTPVQTGIPLVVPMTLPIAATFTQEDTANEQLVLLKTQIGPVNVIFRKIRDIS